MTTPSKLAPYLLAAFATLIPGCSRDTGQTSTAPATPEVIPASPTADSTASEAQATTVTDNLTSNPPGNENPPINREQLAKRIEAGKFIDTSSIDTELARIRRDMIIDRYLEKLYKTNVSTPEIETYYREHAADFTIREIELAHILVRFPTTASAEERDALNTKAMDIKARLHTGEAFDELAKTVSEDEASAAQGGKLGWVAEHELTDTLMTPALQLQAGDVSEPIVTPYGIHILKALSAVRETQKPLAEVRARITQILRASAKEAALLQLAAMDQ